MTSPKNINPDNEGNSQSEGREGDGGTYKSTSFSSIPEDLFLRISVEAKKRGVYPRDLFGEAVLYLSSMFDNGEHIEYVVLRKGGIKRTFWIKKEACSFIDSVSKRDKLSKNVIFVTSLELYAQKEGLNG